VRKLALLIGLALALPTQAEEENPNRWTLMDTSLELTFATGLMIDWMQTTYLTRGVPPPGENWTESNPLLGKHPSRGRVNVYFLTCLIGHVGIAYLLPKPWRTWWQLSGISIEAYSVGSNYSVGFGLRLPWK